ncbi:MAG: hypothetical protein K8L99_34005 [Anaerolineae bacterium]|nr:hypothetical protein [Anaerolineae bacterium]
MQTVIDVVDLLQLQETWVRLPIVVAFSRLSQRESIASEEMGFSVEWLQMRLMELRRSFRQDFHRKGVIMDPSKIALSDLSDSYIQVLYPDEESPDVARSHLFDAVYRRYVVERYQGEREYTCDLLRALAQLRPVETEDCLNDRALPEEGSSFWIPADLTDEIRSLDSRYDETEPNTPAAYVIADAFWEMLAKANEEEIEQVTIKYAQANVAVDAVECQRQLTGLVNIAQMWARSPSVVGLYYQV